MIDVSNVTRTAPALTRGADLDAFNRVCRAYGRDSIHRVNLGKPSGPSGRNGNVGSARGRQAPAPAYGHNPASRPPWQAAAAAPPVPRVLPVPVQHRGVLRGQKTALGIPQGGRTRLKIGFGWNVLDGRCDIDASAFLLAADGRVPSDDWFVFYGQPNSPDGSVRIEADGRVDRQVVSVDLGRLDPSIQRVVFVMTINEALENRLNFGMIRDAWLRVLDDQGRELLSYRPEELYPNITSMTLGELYLHRGEWKFNPVGNGVNTDLAGQCAVYGVAISE